MLIENFLSTCNFQIVSQISPNELAPNGSTWLITHNQFITSTLFLGNYSSSFSPDTYSICHGNLCCFASIVYQKVFYSSPQVINIIIIIITHSNFKVSRLLYSFSGFCKKCGFCKNRHYNWSIIRKKVKKIQINFMLFENISNSFEAKASLMAQHKSILKKSSKQ